MKFVDLLKRLLGKDVKSSTVNGSMNREMLVQLMDRIERTQDVELTCDEVLALMDQFAEMRLRGEDAAQYMPLIQQHLDLCADCQEELDALMRILRASPNGSN
jgi:hypothetical protein